MKKLLLAVLLLSTITAHAASRKGFYLGFNTGIGASTVYYDNFATNYSIPVTISPDLFYGIGVSVGGMFNNHIGLFSGVNFSKYNYTFKVAPGNSADQEQGFIDIPINLRYISSKPGRIGFYLNTGFDISFLYSATVSTSISGYQAEDNTYDFYVANLVFVLNPGLYIPLGNRGNLFMGPRFQTQSVNNFDNLDGDYGLLMANSFNANFSFRLGR